MAACGQPGASVSRLAGECGVNTNQLSRWLREHSQRRQRAVAVSPAPRDAFVAVPTTIQPSDSAAAARMGMQARLPNGVVLNLREVGLRHSSVVIEALGRVRCSVSTKR